MHIPFCKIVTFQELIDLAKAQSAVTGRTIALYLETKNPTYHRDLGLPLEDKVIDHINKAGWNSKNAPVYVQSFEPGSLRYMKSKGLNTRLIQLIDADNVDLKTASPPQPWWMTPTRPACWSIPTLSATNSADLLITTRVIRLTNTWYSNDLAWMASSQISPTLPSPPAERT